MVGEETLDGTENTQMEGEDGVVDEGKFSLNECYLPNFSSK